MVIAVKSTRRCKTTMWKMPYIPESLFSAVAKGTLDRIQFSESRFKQNQFDCHPVISSPPGNNHPIKIHSYGMCASGIGYPRSAGQQRLMLITSTAHMLPRHGTNLAAQHDHLAAFLKIAPKGGCWCSEHQQCPAHCGPPGNWRWSHSSTMDGIALGIHKFVLSNRGKLCSPKNPGLCKKQCHLVLI